MLDRIEDLIKAYKCIIQDIKDEQGEQCAMGFGDVIDIGRIQAYECVVMDLERILKMEVQDADQSNAVSREAVRDMFCEIHCHNERSKCAFRNICKYMNHVSALPPVTPLPDKIDGMLEDAYEHGYQQARYDYEAQPCEDAVSREAVLDALHVEGRPTKKI